MSSPLRSGRTPRRLLRDLAPASRRAAERVGPATGTATAYVNGMRYTGDPRWIVLTEHEDIKLDVGTPIVSPEPVDWSTSQL